MMPLDAWLKLCKVMKEDELYLLKTFTILNHPSLAYYAKRDRFNNLIFYGEPKMGGLKLPEPIVMGKDEFTALFPLYFSKELFADKYREIIPDAPFIFPLIDRFIIKEQEFLEADELVEDKPKEEEEESNVQNHDDDHLRAKHTRSNL